jgi:hypothetical protein
MTGTSVPRIVVVARPTEYAALLARHGTREQARFFLATRGRSIAEVEARTPPSARPWRRSARRSPPTGAGPRCCAPTWTGSCSSPATSW